MQVVLDEFPPEYLKSPQNELMMMQQYVDCCRMPVRFPIHLQMHSGETCC